MLKLNKKLKNILLLIFLNLLSLCFSLTAENRKIFIGLQTGYSFYTPRDYNESSTLWSKSIGGNRLGLLFGANLQVRVSQNWILQGEINYQKRTFFYEYVDYQHPEFNSKGEEDNSYLILHINFLYNFYTFKEEKITLHLLSGLARYRYSPLSSKIGMAGKYHFLPKTNLNLSVSFISSILLYDAEGGGICFFPLAMKHISLNLGLEYEL